MSQKKLQAQPGGRVAPKSIHDKIQHDVALLLKAKREENAALQKIISGLKRKQDPVAIHKNQII